jgi:hypothetical protein
VDLRGLIDDLVHSDKAERYLPPIDNRVPVSAASVIGVARCLLECEQSRVNQPSATM